jgi:hypothetical protein
MSPRFAKIAVMAAALIFSGGFGVWAATAAPASEKPPNITPGAGGGGIVPPKQEPTTPAANPVAGIVTTPSPTFDVGGKDPSPSPAVTAPDRACASCGVDDRGAPKAAPGQDEGGPAAPTPTP